ncbi:MAG TPA: alpha/beta hydrolase, partial [Roseateles sp.]|nr:alpha/beta hydrolase [Roseateles sp.]
PGERVAVIGVSLGAASLVLARSQPAPSAVVLEAMYPTIEEAVAARLRLHLGQHLQAWAAPLAPLLLWQLPLTAGIAPERLRPIEALPALQAPVLLVAGALDRHTPLAQTRRLYAAARAPKALWVVDGAAHVDLHEFDRTAYEATVAAFLERHLRPAAQ